MSSFNSIIPLGFRFEPTDEELIKGFLWPRLTGHQLPWNGILEKEVYGDNAAPWVVFDDASTNWHTKREGGATKKTVYAFTTLTKVTKEVTKVTKGSNSRKISRKAGCGTWSGQTGPKEIINSDTGDVIGNTRMFSFQCRKSEASSDLGHWIMHEYFLSDVFAKLSGHPNAADFVLCKITKIIKDSRGHRSQPLQLCLPAIENKKRGGEEIEQEGCKKQKCSDDEGLKDVDVDLGSLLSDLDGKGVVEAEDGEGFAAAECSGEGFVEAVDWNNVDLENLLSDLDGDHEAEDGEGFAEAECGGEGVVEAEDWNNADLENLLSDLDGDQQAEDGESFVEAEDWSNVELENLFSED